MEQNNSGYKRLWLSYFDILGFKNLVKSRSDYEIYNKYNEALAAAKRNSENDPTSVYCRFFPTLSFFIPKMICAMRS